jgi:hypothetical protein
MATVYRVPEFYTLDAALTAASPGDTIQFTETHTDKFTLTKAVHLIGLPPGPGALPSTGVEWGYNNDSIITLDIPPENWGDVTELYVENLDLYCYNGYDSNKGYFKVVQDFPVGRRLVVNRCVLREKNAGDSQVFYSRSQPEHRIFASFFNCWFTYRYQASGDHGPQTPSNRDTFITADSQLTFEWCVGKHYINADCVEKLQSNFSYTNYVVSSDDIGTLYGPWNGTDRFGSGFDAPNYALYGEITDIPAHIDTTDFQIELYQEVGSYTNKKSLSPLGVKGFDEVIQTSTDPDPVIRKGTWRWDFLPPGTRYGVLIQPPDGMQGHWLRWYQPEALALD